MNEIENNQVIGQEETDNDLDLLEEIKNLKNNSVSKEEYNKVIEKNKSLMKQIINGVGTRQETDEPIDLQEVRKDIFERNDKLSNREFWKQVLTLRKERLEKEGVDVFCPRGNKTRYTREDIETANHLAETIQHIIEDSEENPALFTAIMNNALN